MNLENFVNDTLTQIVSGVCKAQESEYGAFVSPTLDGGHAYADHGRFSDSARLKSTIVDFDVAVTCEKAKKGGAGGGLKVVSVEFSANGGLESKNSTVSRVQFAVPILLPANKRDWNAPQK